jgi:predicted nuclease of predicted toxin-antitoxin system
VKLLLDQNLSHHLVKLLADVFPDSEHVREVGLRDAEDTVIWQYATQKGLMIVSKDTDFHQRSFLLGHPPKGIWVRLGNCSTADVEVVLRKHLRDIERFSRDEIESLLILS